MIAIKRYCYEQIAPVCGAIIHIGFQEYGWWL